MPVSGTTWLQARSWAGSRRLRTSVLSWQGLRGNPIVPLSILVVMGLQLLFTYQPSVAGLFNSRPITMESWALVGVLAVGLLLVVETEKLARAWWARTHA